MTPPEKALAAILDSASVLAAETVGFADAAGRCLAEDLKAPEDMPPFDRSAMDGYAVRAADVATASEGAPASLDVIALAQAGRPAGVEVGPGQAVRIMTGGMVPAGADTVVIQETTREEGGRVLVLESLPAGKNICYRGEDVARGEVLLAKGTPIAPAAVGLLASAGIVRVSAVRRPKVAVLSTGDELVDAGETPAPGQIRDANRHSLQALLAEAGAEAAFIGAAGDTEEALLRQVARGLEFDALITTGGVSVGEFDLVEKALARLGVEVLFQEVAIKPGKPVVFGRKGGALVFGLPGNPTSAVVSFYFFVRPALLKMAGRGQLFMERREATLGETLRLRPGRRQLLRARFDERGGQRVVRLTGHQGAANLLGAALANCLIDVDAQATVAEKGSAVTIHVLPHAGGSADGR